MIRILSACVILLSLTFSSYAQHKITGKIINEQKEPLSYATVALLSTSDSTLLFFGVSNEKGEYIIRDVKPADYIMHISYVGMITMYNRITVSTEKEVNLGETIMKPSMLKEIVIEGEYVPIKFKGDTVEFNAKAFDTKPDAVVEDLLKKLPGIEVDKSGNIKAMGEDVGKVLVDGKEFFGNDLKVATKNLPADAVDKIEVFDKKSENAEFTGVDDGVLDRTINILLNENAKKGYFGKVAAGVGTEDHYKAAGNLYRFSSSFQSAILGNYNNINKLNFSGDNEGSWGGQIDGLNTTASGGLNLSYNMDRNNRYFCSYLGSFRKTSLLENTTTEYFLNNPYEQEKDLNKQSTNLPHRVNFGVRRNFKKKHKVTVDGNLNLSSSTVDSKSLESQHQLNQIQDQYNILLNNIDNQTNKLSESISANGGVDYMGKLKGDTTQVRMGVNINYNDNLSELDWRNITTSYDPDTLSTVDQYQDLYTDNFSISASPRLVQRLATYWNLSIGGNVGENLKTLNREQGDLRTVISINDSLSPNFSTNEYYVKPFLSFQRQTKETRYYFKLGALYNQFDKVLNSATIGKKNYLYFTPSFRYENSYRKGKRIRVRYRSSVKMPSVSQLIPVANTINPLSISSGNIDLNPEYSHSLSGTWSIFDQFSFTSLWARIGGSYTKDKISWSQNWIESATGGRIKERMPVNVPYQYSVGSSIYFSTPIRKLGVDFEINSFEDWSEGISMVNGVEDIETVFSHSIEIEVENRKTDKVEISVGGSVTITTSDYSTAPAMSNVYYGTDYYAQLRLTPNDKWGFWANANVVNYNSKNFSEVISIPLVSSGISYYFGKKGKNSINIEAFDLLNKNTSFQIINETNYLRQKQRNIIGRFAMVSLVWNLGKGMGQGGGGGRGGHRR